MTNRILVTESDTDLLSSMAKTLSAVGYDVVATSHGTEMNQLIDCFRPDIVVTDMILPDEDSIDWLDEFRHGSFIAKVIAISNNDYLLRLAMEHGADFALQKPFEPGQIHGLVRRALDGPWPVHI